MGKTDWYDRVRGDHAKLEYNVSKAGRLGTVYVSIDAYADGVYTIECMETASGWGQYVRSQHATLRGARQRVRNMLEALQARGWAVSYYWAYGECDGWPLVPDAQTLAYNAARAQARQATLDRYGA